MEALLELSSTTGEVKVSATRRGRRHYRKQPGEAPRVAPSERRVPKRLLIEIGRARTRPTRLRASNARRRGSGGERHLEPADVLVDAMRGRFTTWTRIRVNLQHVPAALRPAQAALDPDDDLKTSQAAPR